MKQGNNGRKLPKIVHGQHAYDSYGDEEEPEDHKGFDYDSD